MDRTEMDRVTQGGRNEGGMSGEGKKEKRGSRKMPLDDAEYHTG